MFPFDDVIMDMKILPADWWSLSLVLIVFNSCYSYIYFHRWKNHRTPYITVVITSITTSSTSSSSSLYRGHLTHWGRDKMAGTSDIFKCIFFHETDKCWLSFHWSLFRRVNQNYSSIGSDNGLAQNRRQAIIWTNVDTVHRRIYAASEGYEVIIIFLTTSYANKCALTSATLLKICS